MQGVHIETTSGSGYIGAQGDINIWNPKVKLAGDSTTAQMWLKGGNGFDFESIEAGWTVSKFFIYFIFPSCFSNIYIYSAQKAEILRGGQI
jgi:hypothetical protein